jgi:hypothetical protein
MILIPMCNEVEDRLNETGYQAFWSFILRFQD